MALEPITTDGPTITVSTAEELMEAYQLLSHQEGGGTILLEGGEYGVFSYYPYGENYVEHPVVIKSADPENPAEFDKVSFREVSNVRLENLRFDSTDNPDVGGGFSGHTVDNVQVVDCTFIFDEDNAIKDSGEWANGGGGFRDLSDVLLQGCYFDGLGHGFGVTRTIGVEILDNEFTNLQGDGLRLGGIQDALIDGNYMHDFYGSPNSVNHDDLIQLWGADTDILTMNVTISNNILLSSDSESQSIFIRNEEFGNEGDPTSGYYQNITISNNLIYNAHTNGVRVNDTEGLIIENNTLLYNPDAGATMLPVINATNSPDATITGNIAPDIWAMNGATVEDNVYISYDSHEWETYVANHFVNPLVGASVTPEDLAVLPSSPWYGTFGSSFGNTPDDISDGVTAVIMTNVSADDQYIVIFDAGGSFDASGATSANLDYSYHWSFADGTTAEGLTVTKAYDDGGFKSVSLQIRLDGEIMADIARNTVVETKDIFAFDFEDGIVDISDGVPILGGAPEAVEYDGSGAMRIGNDSKLYINRETEELFDLDSFGLAMDLTSIDGSSGVFLHLNQVMEGKILSNGSFEYKLTTDEGTYSLTSREPIFDDGETHRIGIAFNGDTGQLELFADGESVSSVEAWGTTPSVQYWGLVFGNSWNDSMDAIIDNVVMSVDPTVAGDLPMIDPPEEPEEPPVVTDPPAEDPPPEDPPADEEPPNIVDTTNHRGTPPDPVVVDHDSSNILSKLMDIFLQIFGLGSDKGPAPVTEAAAAQAGDTTLSDVVPITETLAEDAPAEVDEEDETLDDLAA